jgi:hypothetical protein
LIRQYQTQLKKGDNASPAATLASISDECLKVARDLWTNDYQVSFYQPLVRHLCAIFSIEPKSFSNFPTCFPLQNPPVDKVVPYNPTAIASPTKKLVDSRVSTDIKSSQKAKQQRSLTANIKTLIPHPVFKPTFLDSRVWFEPKPFDGWMHDFVSTIFQHLDSSPNHSVAIGRLVRSPLTSKKYFQPGHLYLEKDTSTRLRCDWILCRYRDEIYPPHTQWELVEGVVPHYEDATTVYPTALFAESVWEDGGYQLLPPGCLLPPTSGKSASGSRRNQQQSRKESAAPADVPKKRKADTTHEPASASKAPHLQHTNLKKRKIWKMSLMEVPQM